MKAVKPTNNTRIQLHLKYISSIDGLRAIAVLAVVLFHSGFSWAQGGFVGVDVFFVISGFLITSNLIRDLGQQSFQLSTFYLRRIARLLPALFTVIILTGVASYFILSPTDLARLGQSGIYSTLSVSNFFFFGESGYFDRLAETKPLLHTWSLSVEEQFYLIWPTLILVLYKFGSRTAVLVGLILLSSLSLFATIYYYKENPNMVFFLTPFRIYQFGLGALVAILGLSYRASERPLNAIFGFFGVLVIFLLCLFIDGETHPFVSALLPAVAAAAFIYSAQTAPIEFIFSSKIFIWFGQRSYSIYLVHWPIMVLWKLSTDYTFTDVEKVIAIALSLFFGAILYSLVESRFRFTVDCNVHKKARVMAGTAVTLVLILVTSAHYWGENGYPKRIPEDLRETAGNLMPRWTIRQNALNTGTCNILLKSHLVSNYNLSRCMNTLEGKRSYMVIGDSFAAGAYLIFKQSFPDVNFGQLTIPGCRLRMPKRINNEKCAELYKLAINELAINAKFDGVVLSSNWLDGHLYEIDELIKAFSSHNLDVVMVGQRIRFKDRLPSIVGSSLSKDKAYFRAQELLKPEPFDLNSALKKRFASSVEYVDFIQLQCPDKCDVFNSLGQILYLDDSHFSMEGINVISDRLRELYPALLNSNS